MKRIFLSFLLLGVLGSSVFAQMKTKTDLKMFLVLLKIEKASDIARCYTQEHDLKKIGIDYAFEDSLDIIDEFVFEEDALEGPDCFVPDLKMIFENHTYVISLYCTKVLKYHNLLPYTPSNKRIENDLKLTEGLVEYLGNLKKRYFGIGAGQDTMVKKINASDPIVEKKVDNSVLDLLLNEDWEEELEEEELKTVKERLLPDEEEVEEEIDQLETKEEVKEPVVPAKGNTKPKSKTKPKKKKGKGGR